MLALTGKDTDRLAEEKRRGISIELGYAPLRLASGRQLSVIDVPGHERLVRTMVAGATGIDLFLMVVAADDGVMPQTREHTTVLRALGITQGVVAVTKSDLAEPARAAAQAAELWPGTPVIPVSARTGAGLDDLRVAIDAAAAQPVRRGAAQDEPVLHVDRCFSIRGAGTIATGTLWSGAIARGDEVLLLPSGRRARVRSVEVHDEPTDRAPAGQRVAVNLVGIEVRDIARGDVITSAGAGLAPTHILDVALEDLRLEHGSRVMVHHGTRETAARVGWLGGRFHQLRCEAPLIAARGDRVVVRSITPAAGKTSFALRVRSANIEAGTKTLGGGVVLDPRARKHGPSNDVLVRLTQLLRGEPVDGQNLLCPPAEPETRPATPPPLSAAARALEAKLRAAGHEPPIESELAEPERALLPALRGAGRAVRVGRALHYHPDALAEIERRIIAVIEREGAITLARLRDELGTTRKFAQALLEHFDGEHITLRRADDSRVLRHRKG